MEHLGDITKISGKDAPVVNVIIGGSPCQDLSIAGKRAGLAGARSGLFMEQIRIIKEMRKTDEDRGRKGTDVRPRFMVWENVPGAFSSNGGEDFRAVLEETVRIADENALIPRPANGKWRASGCILGDGFSLAWRVLDTQFWGVPQRRRRIALVADFGGHTAPEILFERESVPRDPAESGTARENAAGDAADCVGITNRGGSTGGVSETLRACSHGALPMVLDDADGVYPAVARTLTGRYDSSACVDRGQNVVCIQGNCIDRADTAGCNGKGWTEDVSYTLNTIDRHAVCIGNGQANQLRLSDKAGALTCVHDQQAVLCAAVDCRHGTENTEVNGTLQAKSNGRYSCNMQNVVRQKHCIRRLTPLECERLQGYPDFWTDIGAWTDSRGKTHKESTDAARYKALGNSIALPPWRYVLQKLSLCCGGDWTMASLFDGIGGFPLIWEQLNGAGACLWASEIEEFPIAVTKYHFGGK